MMLNGLKNISSSMKYVLCNWKMYLPAAAQRQLADEIANVYGGCDGVVLFPSLEVLGGLEFALEGTGIVLGAQQCHWAEHGAHTGEVAAYNLAEVGCRYVLVGHSERRAVGETDDEVNGKVHAALAAGLIPVICVGEDADEHAAGKAQDVVAQQVEAALADVPEHASILIAYEPIWSISDGSSPVENMITPAEAGKMCANITSIVGDETPVLYGGSVDQGNAAMFMEEEAISGVLVGGASTTRERLFPILDLLQ